MKTPKSSYGAMKKFQPCVTCIADVRYIKNILVQTTYVEIRAGFHNRHGKSWMDLRVFYVIHIKILCI